MTTVETNRRHQARAGDKLICKGVPVGSDARDDFIVTGSSTVTVFSQLAARKTDRTLHGPGEITVGSSNVEIGGKRAGATLGNPRAGIKACEAAREGRNPPEDATDPNGYKLQPKTPWQSYSNCGLEATRQVLNQARPEAAVTQEELLYQAMDDGLAERACSLYLSGSSSQQDRVRILDRYLVPADQATDNSMAQIAQLVAGRRGVVAAVWAAKLWPKEVAEAAHLAWGEDAGAHGVFVTGVEFDENGNLKNVIFNDTGLGKCGQVVPAEDFDKARILGEGDAPIATLDPIW
jgi:uncharacterized Zn-binding protein involved in type VI secretion